MDYVLPNEQTFAHIQNEFLVETVLPAGTVAHVLEIGDSYTALTGNVMTRLELQIDGHELPFIHYAKNFQPVHKATCCGKLVKWEEYVLNHGMCHECMDMAVDASNQRMMNTMSTCTTCGETMNYPEDEMVYLDHENQTIFFQDAMDCGYAKSMCSECHSKEFGE